MFVIKCFISYALHSDFLKLSHTMSCSVITVPFIVLNTILIRGVGGINILSTLQYNIFVESVCISISRVRPVVCGECLHGVHRVGGVRAEDGRGRGGGGAAARSLRRHPVSVVVTVNLVLGAHL